MGFQDTSADPHAPTCTHAYHSTQQTRLCKAHTRIVVVRTNLTCDRLLFYRGCHQVESFYSYGAKQPTREFSVVLLGSSFAQSNPVITCQISRVRPPRARSTEPARNPNLRRGVQAGPLRAPQPRAREETHGR